MVNAFFNGGEKAVAQLAKNFDDFEFPGSDTASSVLAALEHPLHGDAVIDDPVDDFAPEDGAYAKPAHAGGNKDDDGAGVKGGGRGKNKDTGGDTGGTDSGGTDTGGTDTGSTDPEPTPEPTPDPEPGYTAGNYVSGLDTPNGYNIEVELMGNWTNAYKQALYDVLEEISNFVTGDLPSHNGIDDFKLLAVINAIDGTGGYMGVGGTLAERPGSYLPSEGYFRFDEADIQAKYDSGLFKDIVMHEVLHAMGFGTIGEQQGLVKSIDGQMRFVGENAIEAYHNEFPEIAANDPNSHLGVRMTNDGHHWHHKTFTKEMMTSSLYNSGNYLSEMSIAALEDMGYETTYGDNLIMA
ncbi:hypothetical protein R5H30_02205 [Sulfitobacter sp. D35]|uniref:hypothetical protein n=1 Tax=Sulfitobacter sp. D35 TaxID=3083252 RepID=UPI00296FC730|nr:hypothetical protein [Sulfitobacter sp. D35]MDW4496778.1 hypothetical protein [Sulfitobacter sp. D35]